jgi:type II secretory pathway pseudopilin PulG
MTFLLANWKLILVAILIAACGLFYGLWQSSEAKLAKVKAAGEYAQQEAERINAIHEKAFKETQDAWAIAVPTIRANAVAEYRKRNPGLCNASQVSVPGTPQGSQGADGAGKEQLACSAEFIRDCGEDAGKVGAWIMWAYKNQLSVE